MLNNSLSLTPFRQCEEKGVTHDVDGGREGGGERGKKKCILSIDTDSGEVRSGLWPTEMVLHSWSQFETSEKMLYIIQRHFSIRFFLFF